MYKVFPTLNQYRLGQAENRRIRKKAVKNGKGNTDEKRALSRYINFAYLKRINPDIIAWIWVPGTAVDYPVVKTSNDEYYLHRNIYRNYRYSGSIFMEYLCKKDFSSENTILYGHNMRDGSMFATLNRFGRSGFIKRHNGVYIYLPDAHRSVICYKAFSYNVTRMSSTTYTTRLSSFNAYVRRAKLGASATLPAKKKGKTLMLSTCYTGYSAYRRVLFSVKQKMVKR